MKELASMEKGLAAFKIGAVYDVDCFDKDGNLKWQDTIHNLVPDAALTWILDVLFHNVTPVSTWYVGLYEDTAPSATWTNAGDLSEFTDYSGNRPEFQEAAASGQSITNAANRAVFNITAASATTIYGCFLIDTNTGNGSHLISAGNFDNGSRDVQNGDVVYVTVTINASSV